jgi:hypothetical protein
VVGGEVRVVMSKLGKAISAMKRMTDRIPPLKVEQVTVDQNGVVWLHRDSGVTITSREGYEALREIEPALPAFEDLPFHDSHDQNIVDVD